MFAATLTEPSALTVSGPVVTGVTVTFAGTTATPFSVSLESTFNAGTTPPVSPLAAPVSFAAMSAAATTVSEAVAGSQLAGLRFSQIRYVIV